ncbi:MAG: DUF5692 family protein [Candidatus Izemoplasmatales bacterium]|nr:DUF5692 family protein [Candidatus Izemoplasmatales bacterium]
MLTSNIEMDMFDFSQGDSSSFTSTFGMWILVVVLLFAFNEFARRWKWAGFFSFFVLPVLLTVSWFTILKGQTYTDWFHLFKVYSSTAGCIGFWLIRHVEKKDAAGNVTWKLRDNRFALLFPPLILAINILEAVIRDFEIGLTFWHTNSGPIMGEVTGVIGGSWNFMNGVAGILNIIAITGFVGIVVRKRTKTDTSKDMIWPDMLWFWIIAYDIWNFTYTYNAIPTHSFYAGLALLIAPTLCAFTLGKGAWLQHRAQTLAIWCMFAQTIPMFQDSGKFLVTSTYNTTIYTVLSLVALLANVAVVVYVGYKVFKTKRNPYTSELFVDLKGYQKVKALAE